VNGHNQPARHRSWEAVSGFRERLRRAEGDQRHDDVARFAVDGDDWRLEHRRVPRWTPVRADYRGRLKVRRIEAQQRIVTGR
jgi:hypothetical protein